MCHPSAITGLETTFLHSVRRLLVAASVVPSSPILVTLMKETLGSFETSVLTRATRRNIPEDTILQIRSEIVYNCHWVIRGTEMNCKINDVTKRKKNLAKYRRSSVSRTPNSHWGGGHRFKSHFGHPLPWWFLGHYLKLSYCRFTYNFFN
jgi:hypothetical protein